MSEITAASVEQSAGIEQVNHAITQMDEVTQQNAALVEEAAAAAESLEEQAQNLATAVATFKVDESGGTPIALRRAPTPAPARKAIAAAQGRRKQDRRQSPSRNPRLARMENGKSFKRGHSSHVEEWPHR